MSYNVQSGIQASRYPDYLTNSWKHLLPHHGRWQNLDQIAQHLQDFDVVGVQETDAGSRRTGFVNLVSYLAEQAQFPYWYHQTTRRLGKFARHSNGILARVRPYQFTEYPLPGLPGRGALLTRFGHTVEPLAIFVVHLALGRRARLRQVRYLSFLINQFRHAVLMGDFNCGAHSEEMDLLLRLTTLCLPTAALYTFPSWRPQRRLDHILVTQGVEVEEVHVPDWRHSDHLPVAMTIRAPATVRL